MSFQPNFGAPHVDGDVRDVLHLDIEDARLGLELERLAPGLAGDEPPDAAHAVAAGFSLRAIGIVDADVGLGAGILGIVQHHHLVEMRRRPFRDGMGCAPS